MLAAAKVEFMASQERSTGTLIASRKPCLHVVEKLMAGSNLVGLKRKHQQIDGVRGQDPLRYCVPEYSKLMHYYY